LSRRGLDIYNVRINLDAGLVIPIEGLKQKSFVKGDERYAEIAAASIMAKVTRDTHMERLARTHTEYGWERNAGYGTLHHRKAIEKHGITPHHRKTYLRDF
jgi:ribonuclease HII